ncbi:MAG: VanZ family protein [Clostridia bacterium]|nr:VanZ family protein [Clostridia bacterium]
MVKKAIWWLLIILWCSAIFYQSHKPAVESDKSSLHIVDVVNSYIKDITGIDRDIITNHFVRKAAHFTEYFILGFMLFKGLYTRKKLKKTVWLSFFIGALYATTDEIHQLFIPGRAMRATDVLIDSMGILTAVLMLYFFTLKRTKNHIFT